MDNEINELWQAMKGSKYRNVLSELEDIVRDASFDDVLTKTLDIVVKSIHAEAGTLWFYDYFETGRIIPRVVYGSNKVEDFSLGFGEGIAGSVIKENKAELISDCQADDRWANKVDGKTGFVTKSMICVPLGKNQAFGSIQIINKTDGGLYDEKDLEFAKQLAEEITNFFVEHGKENIVGIKTKRQKDCFDLNKAIEIKDKGKLKEYIDTALENLGYGDEEKKNLQDHIEAIGKLLNK